jgi:hypothetical protein
LRDSSLDWVIGRKGRPLADTEKSIGKVGLKDKVVGGGEDSLEFPQQTGVPNSIESLCFVEKGRRAVLCDT